MGGSTIRFSPLPGEWKDRKRGKGFKGAKEMDRTVDGLKESSLKRNCENIEKVLCWPEC